jgi:plasmid stabilization system protein ParE
VDYRIIFTQRALNDLTEIIGHIAEDDGATASCFGSALFDHVDLLRRFPRMGGVIRKRVREDKHFVEILHFRHGSRKSPIF